MEGMNRDINDNPMNPYYDVLKRADYYRSNSTDPDFHKYIDHIVSEAYGAVRTPEQLLRDLDINYRKYLSIINGAKKSNKNNNVEYKIGTTILGVAGTLFLLVALVMFGRYYLQDALQVVLIYLASTVLIVLSETLVKKRMPAFSEYVSSLGLAGLFGTTIFAGISLRLFGVFVSLIIFLVISCVGFAMSRIRKSTVMEIVCSLGTILGVLSYSMLKMRISLPLFIEMAGTVLIVNMIFFIWPIMKENSSCGDASGALKPSNAATRVSVVLRMSFLFMTGIYMLATKRFALSVNITIIFSLLFFLTIFVVYIANNNDELLRLLALCLSAPFLLLKSGVDSARAFPTILIGLGGLLLICAICSIFLRKTKTKYVPYCIFVSGVLVKYLNESNDTLLLLVIIGVLIACKVLYKHREVAVFDAVVTTFCVFLILNHEIGLLSGVVIAIVLIGTFIADKTKAYYEYLSVFACSFFAAVVTGKTFGDTAIFVTVFVLILLFNLVTDMQFSGIGIFNGIAMGVMGLVALIGCLVTFLDGSLLMWQSTVKSITYLLVGIAAILVVFSKKFMLECKGKYIILGVYVTYNLLTVRVSNLWVSVLLMGTAFILIAIGCIINRFEIRIYGLSLSLFTCLKVALYDFRHAAEINRIIVFTIVGALAMLISFSYLMLEKHEKKEVQDFVNDNVQ